LDEVDNELDDKVDDMMDGMSLEGEKSGAVKVYTGACKIVQLWSKQK
jgi:hypothetical protein